MTADDEVDALYALPPERFTEARNELAKRTGDASIRELKRPSQAAGVVNRLARGRRKELERLVEAGRTLRRAQAAGEGVEEAMRAEREALTALVEAARHEGATSDTALARVRGTLQAAAADDDAAAQVLAGRLERELEPPGFAPLLAAAAATGPRQGADPRRSAPARDRERERRERAERERRLREAKRELGEAERGEHAAERALERARQRVAEARAAVETLGGS